MGPRRMVCNFSALKWEWKKMERDRGRGLGVAAMTGTNVQRAREGYVAIEMAMA